MKTGRKSRVSTPVPDEHHLAELVNAVRAAGQWQVYDVIFNPAHFKGGKVETPAYITVFENGVVIHNHAAIMGDTGHRILPIYVDRGPKGPIRLQAQAARDAKQPAEALKIMEQLSPQQLENSSIAAYYGLILQAAGNPAQAGKYFGFVSRTCG